MAVARTEFTQHACTRTPGIASDASGRSARLLASRDRRLPARSRLSPTGAASRQASERESQAGCRVALRARLAHLLVDQVEQHVGMASTVISFRERDFPACRGEPRAIVPGHSYNN